MKPWVGILKIYFLRCWDHGESQTKNLSGGGSHPGQPGHQHTVSSPYWVVISLVAVEIFISRLHIHGCAVCEGEGGPHHLQQRKVKKSRGVKYSWEYFAHYQWSSAFSLQRIYLTHVKRKFMTFPRKKKLSDTALKVAQVWKLFKTISVIISLQFTTYQIFHSRVNVSRRKVCRNYQSKFSGST